MVTRGKLQFHAIDVSNTDWERVLVCGYGDVDSFLAESQF